MERDSKDAVKIVSSCLPCQKFNIGKAGYHPLTFLTADLPLDHLAIDLKEMPRSLKGNNYILVIIDIFTRFVILKVLKTKNKREVAKALVEVFLLLGFPKILQSDNGKEFCNSIIDEIFKIAQIEKRTITAYHPQANGVSERWIGTIQLSIYKLLEGKDQLWDQNYQSVQYFTNIKVTSRHGSAPYSLLFARSPHDWTTDEKKELDKTEEEKQEIIEKR